MRGEGNSLNNRFLPFSNIETDAVLSFDDDLCPTPKDIVNGFRLACPLNSSVHTYHRDAYMYIQNTGTSWEVRALDSMLVSCICACMPRYEAHSIQAMFMVACSLLTSTPHVVRFDWRYTA